MLITELEAAEMLKCSHEWIYKLRRAGYLPFRAGKGNLIVERALIAFMQPRAGLAGPDVDVMRIYDGAGAAHRLNISFRDLIRIRMMGHLGYITVNRKLYREADILNYLDTEARLIQSKIDAANWAKAYAAARVLNLHKLPPFQEPTYEVNFGIYPDRGDTYTRLTRRGPWVGLNKHGFWYLHWCEPHRSMRRSLKTKDRDEAEAALDRFRKERAGG